MDGQANKMGVQMNELLGFGLCSQLEHDDIEIPTVYLASIWNNDEVIVIYSYNYFIHSCLIEVEHMSANLDLLPSVYMNNIVPRMSFSGC